MLSQTSKLAVLFTLAHIGSHTVSTFRFERIKANSNLKAKYFISAFTPSYSQPPELSGVELYCNWWNYHHHRLLKSKITSNSMKELQNRAPIVFNNVFKYCAYITKYDFSRSSISRCKSAAVNTAVEPDAQRTRHRGGCRSCCCFLEFITTSSHRWALPGKSVWNWKWQNEVLDQQLWLLDGFWYSIKA